jgi:hypothetical protein
MARPERSQYVSQLLLNDIPPRTSLQLIVESLDGRRSQAVGLQVFATLDGVGSVIIGTEGKRG